MYSLGIIWPQGISVPLLLCWPHPQAPQDRKMCARLALTGLSPSVQFNLLFGCSISDYRTFFSSAVTVVGLLMGISHQEEVKIIICFLTEFNILNKENWGGPKTAPYCTLEKGENFSPLLFCFMVLPMHTAFTWLLLSEICPFLSTQSLLPHFLCP